MSQPHISELRQQLLDTLKDLRNREQPMEPDRARAIAQVAGVLVDSAKAEIDYLKVTNQDRSAFLEEPAEVSTDASGAGLPAPAAPASPFQTTQLTGGRTVHRLRG